MQDQEMRHIDFLDWAYFALKNHIGDIAHIRITITHHNGSKTDYMQGGGPPAKDKLGNLADVLVDDIMSLTDKEVLAEAKEDGIDLVKLEDDIRDMLNGAVRRASPTSLGKDHSGEYHAREPRR